MGNKYVRNKEGLLHNLDGPAVIIRDGLTIVEQYYYQEGVLHRDHGPAVILTPKNGNRIEKHYQKGKLHNDDGPAYREYGLTIIQHVNYNDTNVKFTIYYDKLMYYKHGVLNHPPHLKGAIYHIVYKDELHTDGSLYRARHYTSEPNDNIRNNILFAEFLEEGKHHCNIKSICYISAADFYYGRNHQIKENNILEVGQAKIEQAKIEQAKIEQAKIEQAKIEQAKIEQSKVRQLEEGQV